MKIKRVMAAVLACVAVLVTGTAFVHASGVSMGNIGVELVRTVYGPGGIRDETVSVNTVDGSTMGEILLYDESGVDLQFGSQIQPGDYPLVLSVRNAGSIDIYWRVSIYGYILAGDTKLALPGSSGLDYSAFIGDDILLDETSSTQERVVLYGSNLLKSGESMTFCDSFCMDASITDEQPVVDRVEIAEGGSRSVVLKYPNDGEYAVCFEVEIDAVQTHNAQDAIWSAWGCDVLIGSDGRLSLV